MLRLLPFALLAILFALGCTDETCAEERGLIDIEDYIANNNLTVESDTVNGIVFFYDIQRPGGAARPNIESDITIIYEGRETNDVVFDMTPADTTSRFPLSRLIPGWQVGIPLIGAGGQITLYLPSQLGYGVRGAGDAVCPNSDLIFDVELVSFTN